MAADGGLGLEEPSDWYDVPSTHGTDCHLINRDASNAFDREECTFGPTGSSGTGTVVLLGDALANAVGPGVVEAGAARGWNTVQWSREGCPFVGVAPGPHYPACREWQDAALELVEETAPEAVVLANQDLNEAQRAALPGTLGDLERLTDRVVLVAPIADFGDRFPRHRLSLVDPEPAIRSLSRDEVDSQRSGVVSLLEDLAARSPAVVMVDPLDRLCERECSPERDRRWLYLEPRQLTATGARLLSDEFGVALGAP
ncbi:MAG: SGNH hydrolase domain-containing protein [Microthrixaceae bacterium]|nr:SGNH hydrolase domain-containing protein [Microthrixaceae bacterium]